ncbi:MAG: thioredoxin [Bacteroidetes bacterium]|nr:thioredoxin [Bacteroidota bacterium]MCH8523354.1 thioredoxin [Balneolales bacterium]
MSFELQDFKQEVVEQSKHTPVVLDFWAEWCGPCRTLGPVIEKLAKEANGKWKLVKINTEVHQQLAAQFGIRSIPAVKMVYNGALVAEFTGALPEAQIKQWLTDNLPDNGSDDELEEYEKLLEDAETAGDRVETHRLLESMLAKNASDDKLLSALAMSWLPQDSDKAREVLAGRENEGKFELHVQAIETIEWLKKLQDEQQNGSAASATFSAAVQAVLTHDFENAIEGFLEVLAKDRNLHDDGARKSLVSIFLLLGDRHPLTKKYRRRFSMLLY